MGLVYWILYDVLKVAMWTFYRDIRVVGAEHVPRRRPVLICGYAAKLKLRAGTGWSLGPGYSARLGHLLHPPTRSPPSSSRPLGTTATW